MVEYPVFRCHQGTKLVIKQRKNRERKRSAMSLLELIVSMGLLSLIMVPVVSLLGTSYKVMNASSDRQAGSYTRQVALDSVVYRLAGSTQVLDAGTDHITVLLADGDKARLSFGGGELFWETSFGVESLIAGLSNARFSVGAGPGATALAGELFLIEVASRGPGEPQETWSSTQIWIRPAI